MASGNYDFPFTISDIALRVMNLNVRRQMTGRMYVDCPLPGCNPKKKSKMKLDTVHDSFHCYYCGETGGMLKLYSLTHNDISSSDAYHEICQALGTGERKPAAQPDRNASGSKVPAAVPQLEQADTAVIHGTLSALLQLLTLSPCHRQNLRDRGLTDEQIDRLGYKSTPKAWECMPLTERLIQQGCTVQGVPGFYQLENGKWTVKFNSYTAGVIVPARSIGGQVCGAQIRLDNPFKDKDAGPDETGTKYIWLSSCGKHMGVTSGSPVHFVGDPYAKTVYVTEGFLKADISHCLTNRTFAATAGGNNVFGLDSLFALLARNGTELIVEAADMDKYRNIHIVKGASKISEMALSHKLKCRPLVWNPNYKGFDDWQLALKKKKENPVKGVRKMTFKERFLYGLCEFYDLDRYVDAWQNDPLQKGRLWEYIGLSETEYADCQRSGDLKGWLTEQRKSWRFRIYQLDFKDEIVPKPFAFEGIQSLRKAGHEQPPAAEYRLMCDKEMYCPKDLPEAAILKRIFFRYNDNLPEDYLGRSVSPSDVIELCDNEQRRYFYRDAAAFVPVEFSPELALPLKA